MLDAPKNGSVLDLKKLVESKNQVHPNYQHLSYIGKTLNNHQTLHHCGIMHESTIYAVWTIAASGRDSDESTTKRRNSCYQKDSRRKKPRGDVAHLDEPLKTKHSPESRNRNVFQENIIANPALVRKNESEIKSMD